MRQKNPKRRTAAQETYAPLINDGSHCEVTFKKLRAGISERDLPGAVFYCVEVWIKYTLRGTLKDLACCVNQTFARETKSFKTLADLIRHYSGQFTISNIRENVILPEIDEKDIRLGGDTITVQHLRYRVAEISKCYEDEAGHIEILAMALPIQGAYWNWLMSTPEEIADLGVADCFTTDGLEPELCEAIRQKLSSQKPHLKSDVA